MFGHFKRNQWMVQRAQRVQRNHTYTEEYNAAHLTILIKQGNKNQHFNNTKSLSLDHQV